MAEESPTILDPVGAAEPTPIDPEIQPAGDYARVFGTALGREVLKDMAQRFGLIRPIIPTATTTPIELSYLEGQRSVVLHCLQFAEIDIMELNRQLMQATQGR